MRLELGIPEVGADNTLPRRLAWASAARMVFFALLLALLGVLYLGSPFDLELFSVKLALAAVGGSFALAGAYAWVLRSGRGLERLADVQLVFDQLTWSVLVYLTGGASSGATSLYGLGCLLGAILRGSRGVRLSALAGACFYIGLVVLLHTGVLEAPPDQPERLYSLAGDELAYHVLVNLLVLSLVAVLASYLAERLKRTGGQLMVAHERAERAERMAALGRLAAGLAHEIRNPLSSIAGSIQLLKSSKVLSQEDRQLCDIVQREAARLNDLVTDMLDLSRPRPPQFAEVNACEVAREVVALTSKSGRAASDVGVVFSGPEAAMVRADRAQLRQLLWNLVRNAVQASSAGEEVRVSLEQGEAEFCLCVADQGVGIEPEAREQIFDAFFTTRSKGTGIGLAVVKRIADDHGFPVEVISDTGCGATFRVVMPGIRTEAQTEAAASLTPKPHRDHDHVV